MTNFGNITKATYQQDIKRKQAFFNRCKRRYCVAGTPAERQFLKSEATRICTELKQCCKVWKNNNWGTFSWITRGFTTNCFNNVKPTTRHNTPTTRNTFGGRTSNTPTGSRTNNGTTRTYGRRTTTTRPTMKSNNRTRTNNNVSRMSYMGW